MPGWTIGLIWAGIIALLFFLVIVPVFVIPLILYNILIRLNGKDFSFYPLSMNVIKP